MGTKRSIVERLVRLIFFTDRAEAWTGLGQKKKGGKLGNRLMDNLQTNADVFFCLDVCVNDPSAGSPTETLLRLLLPRNVQI